MCPLAMCVNAPALLWGSFEIAQGSSAYDEHAYLVGKWKSWQK